MSEFINVSSIKKLIHDNKRRCSDEFLETLDGLIKNMVLKACEDPNDGMKTLGEDVLLTGKSKVKKPDKWIEFIRDIRQEAVAAELKLKIITKKEFSSAMSDIKVMCDQLLET